MKVLQREIWWSAAVREVGRTGKADRILASITQPRRTFVYGYSEIITAECSCLAVTKPLPGSLRFNFLTAYSCLMWVLNLANLTRRLAWWRLGHRHIDYELKSRSGGKNCKADLLSRLPTETSRASEMDEHICIHYADENKETRRLLKTEGSIEITIEYKLVEEEFSKEIICTSVAKEDEPPRTKKVLKRQEKKMFCKELAVTVRAPETQDSFDKDSSLVGASPVNGYIQSVIHEVSKKHILHLSFHSALRGPQRRGTECHTIRRIFYWYKNSK